MASSLAQQLHAELKEWESAGLRRRLAVPDGIDFTSNDYLALSRDPRLADAAREALVRWGVGAPAARLLRGHLPPHEAAERTAAAWCGDEAALLFPSGWQANQALLTTLAGAGDLICSDARNHASLIDGCRLSRARVAVFAHNDMEHLGQVLRDGRGARRRFVVVESVYSMDGDRAPLHELVELASQHDAWLLVDEAHAAGLFPFFRHERLAARSFTGGKALGVAGGFVAGTRTLVDSLVDRGRSFVFTTAVPPPVAAALAKAMEVVQAEPDRARRALQAAEDLRRALASRGVAAGGQSPIVPVVIGTEPSTLAAADRVRASGFDVRAVRPPTVPPGSSRLRIVCHADHTPEQLTALADAVAGACRDLRETRESARRESRPTTQGAEVLVVAGTDTDVGKTVVSALLARAARQAGRACRYWKPVQTGSDSDTETVRRLAAVEAPDPGVALPLPASVDQAAEDAGVEVRAGDLLRLAREKLRAEPETRWIWECAGGLRVPLNEREDQADFLSALGAPLVLVARSGLGTLNATLLTLEAARSRRLAVRALFLVGEAHAANERTLKRRLPELPIFSLPRFETLDGATLDAWLAHCPLDGLFS